MHAPVHTIGTYMHVPIVCMTRSISTCMVKQSNRGSLQSQLQLISMHWCWLLKSRN